MGIRPPERRESYNQSAEPRPGQGNFGLNVAVFTQFYLQVSFFRANALRILQ